MNVLIFGYGQIAKREYIPSLHREYQQLDMPSNLNFICVDIDGDNYLDIANWQEKLDIESKTIDKILILSPPGAHYENLEAILKQYERGGKVVPEIYLEKPIYLESEYGKWCQMIERYPILDERGFYIDHYRFKSTLAWLVERKESILKSLGDIDKIKFFSLEKQEFWNSSAFTSGYLLEHGCHMVSMLDMILPELKELEWLPRRRDEWRVWEQEGRPPLCGGDSACMAFMSIVGGSGQTVSHQVELDIVVGKAITDAKVLCLSGRNGSIQLWFNEGRFITKYGRGERDIEQLAVNQSYAAVAHSILSEAKDRGLLLSFREGMLEQERIVAIQKHLPLQRELYSQGQPPAEIASELMNLSAM